MGLILKNISCLIGFDEHGADPKLKSNRTYEIRIFYIIRILSRKKSYGKISMMDVNLKLTR